MATENAHMTSRRPYVRPRLVRYGSVRELTRELGPFTEKDGGSNSVVRRSPA